jgi:alpha-glucosidase
MMAAESSGSSPRIFQKNMMKKLILIALLLGLASACSWVQPKHYECESPRGDLRLVFGLTPRGQAFYMAYFQEQLVLDTSLLGLELVGEPDLIGGFMVKGVKENEVDESWEQPWGEEQFIHNHHHELRVELQEKRDLKRKMNLVFRLFDHGLGFRYEFPKQENLRNFSIQQELTQFHMVDDHQAWWIPAMADNRYEYLYQQTPLSQMGKVHTPVTFQSNNDIYLSIHEAELRDYSSMLIDASAGPRLRCELVPYSKEEAGRAFVSAPGKTPWRTIKMASKPEDLINSYLTLNLNEPNQLGDVSWVKPGKYIGIWWEMHIGAGTWASGAQHAANTRNTQKYIDFAAKNGFDGVLVEGWNKGWDGNWVENGEVFSFTEAYPDFDLEALSAYAREKGVYLVGHHETSGNVDNYERQMPEAYALLGKHGVKAVKTGYVEHGNLLSNGKYHHGQAYIDHFHKVIKLAAKHRISVVAHEPIKDTGERRTFPNMVSREGARGQEFNAWSADGGNPPEHETILPFTRCLEGPLDYTPGVFDIKIPSKPNNQVNTTLAKQLALYVVLYSPMQMACDLPENYEKYPDAFAFIKEVGVDWEKSKALDAEIGDYVCMARKERNTGNWFVGAITDEEARSLEIPLDFLEEGQSYQAHIYRDAPDAHFASNPEAYLIETRTLTARDTLDAWLAPGGGLAVSLFQTNNQLTLDN